MVTLMPETIDLVPTAQAATMLGVSIATVNRWAQAGRLAVVAKGRGEKGAQVFHRADVVQLAGELVAEAEARLATLRGAAS
jgi:predicted site-specific integrase-resolvase